MVCKSTYINILLAIVTSQDIDPINISSQSNEYAIETFNSGLRIRIKPQHEYDNWYFRGALIKNDNQFLYRLGLSGNESEISPNKFTYIKPYTNGKFYVGNIRQSFGQGLIWSSPYGRMRSFLSVSSLIKDQFKLKSELSGQSKLENWYIGNAVELLNLQTLIIMDKNLQSISLKSGPISINYTEANEFKSTSMAWNKKWDIVNITGELAENNNQYAFINNLIFSQSTWPTWLLRIILIPQDWKTVDGKTGAGKSSNVNGVLLHGIHKTKHLKLSGWINYETTQQQIEGSLIDAKTDYMSQLSLGKSPQLLSRYRKIETISQSSSLAENGLISWDNFYAIDEWYKFQLKYIFKVESQFHFKNANQTGYLFNINYSQKINERWQLFWGGYVCNLWDEGKFYLYQQGLDGELLIQFISESQTKVYQITKCNINQILSFSNRVEFSRIPSRHKNTHFFFVLQLDIVF